MSTKVTNTDRYQATPAQLIAMMADPDYLAEKYAALGDKSVDIIEQTASDGALIINVERESVNPDALKKIGGDTSKTKQTEDWKAQGDGYAADLHIDGGVVKINGKLVITAVGDSESDWAVELDIKAGVPLVGGKIEKAVAGLSKENMAREYQFNQQWLASH